LRKNLEVFTRAKGRNRNPGREKIEGKDEDITKEKKQKRNLGREWVCKLGWKSEDARKQKSSESK